MGLNNVATKTGTMPKSTILLVVFGLASVWASPAEEKLIKTLFANYASTSRPVVDTNDSLVVNVSFTPIRIEDIDVSDNAMMLHGWMHLSWKDAQLQWNSSDNDGITMLNLPIESLWKPDIKMYNGHDSSFESTLAVVFSDGTVMWVPPTSSQVTCNLSAMWFPFDVQRCVLVFGSWTYDKTKIDLQLSAASPEDEGNFKQNSEWWLLSTKFERREKKYACCENVYPNIEVTMTMRRKACRHVIEHILPLVTIVTLGLLTMMIPATRADIRLLIITLLLGSSLVHIRLIADEAPLNMSIINLLSGQFVFVLSGLFLCNCVHLAVLRGLDCSFLTKLSGLIGKGAASSAKSEALIPDVEHRYHRTLDSVFTFPLAFIAVLCTALFLAVPLF